MRAGSAGSKAKPAARSAAVTWSRKVPSCCRSAAAADRCLRERHDLEIDVLRHALYQLVRPCERGAAAKDQAEGAASSAARAAIARTTWRSFSTSATLGSRKCAWTSRNWRSVSSLKLELRVLVGEATGESALHAHGRIDRHLCRTALVVGALDFRRLPFHAELGRAPAVPRR